MNFAYLPHTVELPDEPRYLLRERRNFGKFLIFLAFAIFFAVLIYLDRASHATFEPLLISVPVIVLAYYWYLIPYLEISPIGLRIVNVFSTREIHWEIFSNIDPRFGLMVTSEAAAEAAGVKKKASKADLETRSKKGKKPRKHRDFVGAFPQRAKTLPEDRYSLWEKTGVHHLKVSVSQLPELIYGMRELHRKLTNPKDFYQGVTARSACDRAVYWNFLHIAVFIICSASIASGVWLLMH